MLTRGSPRAALRQADQPPSPTGRSEPRRGHVVAALRPLVTGYAALTCVLLVIGVLLTHALDGSVGRWDEHVNRWFVAHRTDHWNSFTGVATFAIDTFPVIAVALVVVTVLMWRRRRTEALVIVFGLTLEIAVFLSVTFVVARPRPDVPRLSSTPMTSSFPSGHVAAAIVLYGAIALAVQSCTRDTVARVLAWCAAVIVAVSVGLSRVYRGMHHPTDVIVGAAFGVACLWIAVRSVRAGSEARESTDSTVAAERARQFVPVESELVG